MKPENFKPGLSGKRHEIAKERAIRFPDLWDREREKRVNQFRVWRYMAMQVLNRRGVSAFRVMAILDQVFDFSDCCIYATDAELAWECGHCAEKTVRRDLNVLLSVGLLTAETTWIDKGGKMRKARKMKLAVPFDLTGIDVRGDEEADD